MGQSFGCSESFHRRVLGEAFHDGNQHSGKLRGTEQGVEVHWQNGWHRGQSCVSLSLGGAEACTLHAHCVPCRLCSGTRISSSSARVGVPFTLTMLMSWSASPPALENSGYPSTISAMTERQQV